MMGTVYSGVSLYYLKMMKASMMQCTKSVEIQQGCYTSEYIMFNSVIDQNEWCSKINYNKDGLA
jgi:hypothetical protein